ncbi:MAG: aerobic respiration control sensor protein ArcB [Syntrophorhabdus sp. PtaB.Bin047]|jgi:PAS domain S-box-containing protein|nr:MAG: aerobic respiration control sensor protein ArcB [Syntrophorhabdus sp. PtaB.Bin047]
MIRAGDADGRGSLFRGLLDLIPTTVILVRGHRFIFVNKAAEVGTGYSRDELMAMNFWSIVHPDHRAPTKRLARGLLEGKETSTQTQLRILSKDSSEKWVELRAKRVAIDNHPTIIASLIDVTDRRKMEEELKAHRDHLSTLVEERTDELSREAARRKEKEDQYLSLVECVPGWVWETDANFAYTYLGSRISDYLGYKPEELIGKSPLDIVPADERQRLAPLMKTVIAGKAPFVPFTFQVLHKNGSTMLVEGNARAFFDENGNLLGYRGSARDITREKKTLDELQEYQQELVAKSRRLEEVNTALKVLLRQREDDRKELEQRFVSNIREMVLPYLNRMHRTRLNRDQQNYLDIVMSNLDEIVSPFLNTLRYANLTPRELEVASLVKEGKRTKEIAEIAGIAPSSVDSHRNAIRKKLGLNSKKVNLRSYLLTLR